MDASCWVARKIFLSAASASSSARTLDSRPTTNGVIMKGKMTTSRMGIMGSFFDSNFSLDVVTQSPWGYSLARKICSLQDSTPILWLVEPGKAAVRKQVQLHSLLTNA